MLKKKMKGVSIDSSSSPYAYNDQAKARFNKHQSLMQDFIELQKETEAKKQRLQIAKEKKLTLLAEVRFLRRRYKFLMRNQSPATPSMEQNLTRQQAPEIVRDTVRQKAPKIRRNTFRQQAPEIRRDIVRQQAPEIRRDAVRLPNPTPVLDLNQISNGDEEVDEFQITGEPMEAERKPKNYSINRSSEQQQQNDVNLSVCREITDGANRSRKRKISWQDQVVLKV